jgi:hypothetical protein
MPIHSRVNQYRGVNAHLHSILQNEIYDWESFHSEHLGHLRDALQEQLPEGYFARLERSLQIRAEAGAPPARTKPDILVSYAKTLQRETAHPGTGSISSPVETLPIVATLQHRDEDYFDAAMIYKVEGGGRIGVPVTRLELLSLSNKPPRTGHATYLEKREETLRTGIHLVEIDYLHQSCSAILALPSYPDHAPNAFPYLILVNTPRPTLEEGQMKVYGFHVDDPIPIVEIPLAELDVLVFDFGEAYNRTYVRNPYHRLVVDYEQLPERFESYSPEDQQRIRARMNAVADAYARGLDLEQGPFPIGEESH